MDDTPQGFGHEWLENQAPQEVRDLVEEWRSDPCYDLEDVDDGGATPAEGWASLATALYVIRLETELHDARRRLHAARTGALQAGAALGLL